MDQTEQMTSEIVEQSQQQSQQSGGLLEALSGALGPSSAEASPIGKLVKKVVSGPASSAARRLIGHEISGMEIKNVVKGRDPWRYIQFKNTDQVLPVTKDVINDLARQFGTETYTAGAEGVGGAFGLQRAIKSAEMRLNLKGTGPYSAKELAALNAKHIGVLTDLELTPVEQVLITYRGEKIKIPRAYADILEANGLAKRVK